MLQTRLNTAERALREIEERTTDELRTRDVDRKPLVDLRWIAVNALELIGTDSGARADQSAGSGETGGQGNA
jgi:hypothetical protein